MNTMMSEWVSDGVHWQLKVHYPETGCFKCYTKIDNKGLSDNNTTDIDLKVHLQLERGPKLLGRIGVTPLNDIDSIIGNSWKVFPLIQLGE